MCDCECYVKPPNAGGVRDRGTGTPSRLYGSLSYRKNCLENAKLAGTFLRLDVGRTVTTIYPLKTCTRILKGKVFYDYTHSTGYARDAYST